MVITNDTGHTRYRCSLSPYVNTTFPFLVIKKLAFTILVLFTMDKDILLRKLSYKDSLFNILFFSCTTTVGLSLREWETGV